MKELEVLELHAFVPAKNYEVSKAFYRDLGFTMASDEDGIAYFYRDNLSFLLQDFYEKDHANNFMMHLLVKDVESWYQHILSSGLTGKYQVAITKPEDRPWQMRDFVLYDPSGVLWRIAQNI
jgi:catechol 2,3-dioxygenase-like lactoylglutathione lyase family enzyme